MPESPPRLEMPPVRGLCGPGNGRQRQAWPLGRTVLCGSGGRGAELLAERGQFTIAEGNVWSVRERGGTISMKFRPPAVAGAHGHDIETPCAHVLIGRGM